MAACHFVYHFFGNFLDFLRSLLCHFSDFLSYFCNAEDEHGRSTPLPSLVIEPVKTEDVEAALKHTKPSARQLKDKYNDWQREYESV